VTVPTAGAAGTGTCNGSRRGGSCGTGREGGKRRSVGGGESAGRVSDEGDTLGGVGGGDGVGSCGVASTGCDGTSDERDDGTFEGGNLGDPSGVTSTTSA